jgi:hypothetical protein
MSNDIVRYESLQDLQFLAQTFALTGYFDAKGSQPVEVAKALTKILAGQELGFGPFASQKGIYIIQGSTSVSGHLIASGIKRSQKYDYRVRGEITDTKCTIDFFERTAKGMENIGTYTFTADDAKRAQTKNMAAFPRDMLFNRCISAGYKKFCPDALGNGAPVYTPEELGAATNDAGEYVESTARVVDTSTGEITNGYSKDVAFTPEPNNRPARSLLNKMHAVGAELYGEVWDDKRHELVRKLSKGRTASSEEATIEEIEKMIAGMEKKLAEQEAAQTELVIAA